MGKKYYSNDFYDEIDFSSTIEIADAETGGNVGTIGAVQFANIRRFGDKIEIEVSINNINTTGLTAVNDLYIRGIPFTPVVGSVTGVVQTNDVTFTNPPTVRQNAGSYTLRLAESVSGGSIAIVPVSAYNSGTADVKFSYSFIADSSDL